MNYAGLQVLVDIWVSKNIPSEKVKLVEVDYDLGNGYRKDHTSGTNIF